MLNRSKNPVKIKIRKATLADIMTISQVEHSEYSNPWKQEYFIEELANDLGYFYVSEIIPSKEIAGYMILWIIENTIEIHNITIKKDLQRKGVGSQMIEFVSALARKYKVEKILLEVRESNKQAIKFYEKFNFKQLYKRKNYYRVPQEDCMVYQLSLPGT